jgi:hypothetical protein
MPVLTWLTNHRIWALGMGVALLLVAVAAGVWFFVLRSPGTQVDLRQALRLYKEGQGSGASSTDSELPPAGVYRYQTSGGEELSIGGISRSFPSATNMIVTDSRCATLKWEPLEQHIEGMVECPSANGALTFVSAPSYEDIADTKTTTDIRCPADTYFVPPDPRTNQRWQTTCHSPGQTVVFSGTVVGFTSVKVAGKSIRAIHTRETLTFSGSQTGTNPNEYWISLENGVILRQRETVDVSESTGPLGSVHYGEQMAIDLTSLTPIR